MTAIIAAWQEYQRVYERFAADPEASDLTETQYVTTGEGHNTILLLIEGLREADLKFEGGQVFRDVAVQGPEKAQAGVSRASITYCLDVGQLNLTRISDGTSVDKTGTFRETATMELGADGRWRVAEMSNEELPC